MKKTYKINGIEEKINDFIEVINPSTNETLDEVPALNKEQVDRIYQFAHDKQKDWKNLTISERATFLNKWADLILENKENLANLLVKEIAKNYNDSLTEVIRSAEYIKYAVEEMYRIDVKAYSSEQYYNGKKNKIAISKREAVGVILVISPFNYPINLSISKIAPAIISGNVVVFKPATQGSSTGIELTKLWQQTGAPEGVINLVTGRGREISDFLVQHELINFVNFTGSTNVGKLIASKSGMIPMVMELGGKDAAIVLDDHNLEFVAKDIVSGAFSYSGQRCTATKRVLVKKDHKEKLTNLIYDEVKKLTVGLPEDNNFVTPLIDKWAPEFLMGLLNDLNPKAKILTGGKHKENLFEPTLVTNVLPTDRLAIEEQFGPILPIIEFETVEEAIEIHNESEFGLQGSVYGRDIDELFAIADELETGSVNFNSRSSRGPDSFPFIGYKNSGLGVQGINDSIMSMTKPKLIVINKK